MTASRLTVRIHDDAEASEIVYDTADIRTALAVAEINAVHGRADIMQGRRVIARLAKRGENRANFWEVF
ncbi:hypothetical protein [Qipengyuania spongiae]|uniref:Uncharacterized protein n=1 Tax=Qipengyuania spongiae TaxID=2909673 RepID=A0ABY5SXM1_9SPHN|nr:hypothetical protein [Qipengyuania spongiae]UVI39285.1 hypothetical protein L1F33_13820 [Qipengyuania spongiae]